VSRGDQLHDGYGWMWPYIEAANVFVVFDLVGCGYILGLIGAFGWIWLYIGIY
jgi:hypothetical protein